MFKRKSPNLTVPAPYRITISIDGEQVREIGTNLAPAEIDNTKEAIIKAYARQGYDRVTVDVEPLKGKK